MARISVSLGCCVQAAQLPGRAIAACLGIALMLCACSPSPVAIYTIAKEPKSDGNALAGLVPPAPNALPTWKIPSGWSEEKAGELRLASFRVTGPDASESAEVTLISFPGEAGGLVSNVNRWRDQLGEAALDEETLAKTVRRSVVDGVPLVQVDIAAADAKKGRTLGAIFRTNDRSWFVKMTGPNDLLASQQANFEDFVQSFRFPNQPEATPVPEKVKSTNEK